MDEAHILCDRICLMDKGSIIALDTPDQLIRSLESENAIEFRMSDTPDDSGTWMDKLRNIPCVMQAELRKDTYVLYTSDLQASLTNFVQLMSDRSLAFTDLRTRTATLEDVFIHMTGRRLREE
jgi:ABC-2 type transport system ATP-binding protein